MCLAFTMAFMAHTPSYTHTRKHTVKPTPAFPLLTPLFPQTSSSHQYWGVAPGRVLSSFTPPLPQSVQHVKSQEYTRTCTDNLPARSTALHTQKEKRKKEGGGRCLLLLLLLLLLLEPHCPGWVNNNWPGELVAAYLETAAASNKCCLPHWGNAA